MNRSRKRQTVVNHVDATQNHSIRDENSIGDVSMEDVKLGSRGKYS